MEDRIKELEGQVVWLKEQFAIHAKNTEDALERMAKANKASGAAVDLVQGHDARLDKVEKQVGL